MSEWKHATMWAMTALTVLAGSVSTGLAAPTAAQAQVATGGTSSLTPSQQAAFASQGGTAGGYNSSTPAGHAVGVIPGTGTQGTLSPGSQTAASSVGIANDPNPNLASGSAYWVAHTDGSVDGFWNNYFFPGSPITPLNAPIAGITALPNGSGAWLVGTDGGVFTFGSVPFYGSHLGDPDQMVAIISTPDGQGYWEVSARGAVWPFGDAGFYGSIVSENLPAVNDVVSATAYVNGYCMLESNGVYTCFYYSNGPIWGQAQINPPNGFNRYTDPATTIAVDTGGYCFGLLACGGWITDRTGQVYTYGYGAVYEGGFGGTPTGPIMGSSGTGSTGYRFVGADGGIFDYGLPYEGSNTVSPELGSTNAQAIGQVMLPEGNWGTWAEWNAGPPARNGVASGLLPLYDYEDGGSWVWSISDPYPCSGSNYAYGIPQACPGSKMSSQGPALPSWQTNAWTQIAWGLWYVAPGNNNDPGVTDPDSAYVYDIANTGYAPTA
jgi:hypothetical protein